MKQALSPEVLEKLPFLSEPELRAELLEHCFLQEYAKGEVVVREGQFVMGVPIVLSGSVRVSKAKEDREILLYYVNPRQTCMMSLSACFFGHASPSQATAVTNTMALIVPAKFPAEWQRKYHSWNKFVLSTFRNRYDELMSAFESVAFDHIDRRLWKYLEMRSVNESSKRVEISHQALAHELGTTRVVVSRILKELELQGQVRLGRGNIELLD